VDRCTDIFNSDPRAINLVKLGGASFLVIVASRPHAGFLLGLRLAVPLEAVEGFKGDLVLAASFEPLAVENDVALVLNLLVDAAVAVPRSLTAIQRQHAVLDVYYLRSNRFEASLSFLKTWRQAFGGSRSLLPAVFFGLLEIIIVPSLKIVITVALLNRCKDRC